MGRQRHEDQPWYAEWKRQRETHAARDDRMARRESPYRADSRCDHTAIVETTCDYQATDWTLPIGGFCIRLRTFACAACGVGRWPEDDKIRQNALHLPRCTRPLCACDYHGRLPIPEAAT